MSNELGGRSRNVQVVVLVQDPRIDNMPKLDVVTISAKVQLERITRSRLIQLLARQQSVTRRSRRKGHHPNQVAAVAHSATCPEVVITHPAVTSAGSIRMTRLTSDS